MKFLKLPLTRKSYSGSTDSWIEDADGNDITRCSCGRCPCGRLLAGNVAIPDKAAQIIVDAVNGFGDVAKLLEELVAELPHPEEHPRADEIANALKQARTLGELE